MSILCRLFGCEHRDTTAPLVIPDRLPSESGSLLLHGLVNLRAIEQNPRFTLGAINYISSPTYYGCTALVGFAGCTMIETFGESGIWSYSLPSKFKCASFADQQRLEALSYFADGKLSMALKLCGDPLSPLDYGLVAWNVVPGAWEQSAFHTVMRRIAMRLPHRQAMQNGAIVKYLLARRS